jgi:RNA polymerase sigma factor (sigma-70 family)
VKRDQGPPTKGAPSFHTPRWTIVMRAPQNQALGGHSALAQLCRNYRYPLCLFARRRGHSPDDARDLTQAFFLHLLEQRAFSGIDRLKGKFRSFLLAPFPNHLSDQVDRARRLKRGGDKEFVHLDAEDAEERYHLQPAEFSTAEKMFDARWAMTLLVLALNRISSDAVNALIHRLRKRYTALLREEVSRTASDPAEIDEEIHALCEALIASEGRLGP